MFVQCQYLLSCSQIPLTGATARVRFLDVSVRPGNIDTDPELRNFILADHLQMTLLDFFTDNTTTSHRYYGILEIIIAGRLNQSLVDIILLLLCIIDVLVMVMHLAVPLTCKQYANVHTILKETE